MKSATTTTATVVASEALHIGTDYTYHKRLIILPEEQNCSPRRTPRSRINSAKNSLYLKGRGSLPRAPEAWEQTEINFAVTKDRWS
jgi:hypothetical protein